MIIFRPIEICSSLLLVVLGCLSFFSCDKHLQGDAAILPFNPEKLNACLAREDRCVLALSVATKNIDAQTYTEFTDSMKIMGYDSHVIGRDLIWHGWITRGETMRKAMASLKEYFSPEALKKIIVVSTDTGDVLTQRPPKELLRKYYEKTKALHEKYGDKLDTENLIIVGSEWYCGTNCGRQSLSWYDRLGIPESKRAFAYPQGGFIMGPPEALLNYYTHTVNFMNKVENDDQIAMGDFIANNPSKAYIDYLQEIVATTLLYRGFDATTGLNYDINEIYQLLPKGLALGKELLKLIGTNENIYPAFIHMPNNRRDDQYKKLWERFVDHLQKTVWNKN